LASSTHQLRWHLDDGLIFLLQLRQFGAIQLRISIWRSLLGCLPLGFTRPMS
jgi:hypothetical protein